MSALTDAEAAIEQAVQNNTDAIASLKIDVTALKQNVAAPLDLAPLTARVADLEARPAATPDAQQVFALWLQAITGGALTSLPSGGATGGVATPPVNYFPADPGAAPFPSPENSTSTVIHGKVSGALYVRSAQGAIWQFDTDANGALIPITSQWSTGYQASVNGVAITNTPIQMLMVRQGQVYFEADTIWSALEQTDSPISGIAHTTPPPPWVASGTDAGGQTTQLPDMPAAPAAFTGWTGNVLLFGPGRTYPDMQAAHDAAQPGDTIQPGPELVGKTVTMTLGTTKPLIVDLLGRTSNAGLETATYVPGVLLDISSLDFPQLPHQLGAIVPTADCVVRGVDCTGAGMKSAGHDGTSAIRAGAALNLLVDHCNLHKNQNGVGPSGFNGTLAITNTLEVDNFLPTDQNPGGSHNVYAEGVSATFGPGFTSIVNPAGLFGGHAVKSRAKVTNFVEPYFLYSADSSSVDIPDGSTAVCHFGAGTIAKKAGDANHTVVGYGVESQNNGLAGASFSGTKFALECDSPQFGTTGPLTFDAACVFTGNKPTAPQGAPVKGLPA